MKLSAVMLARVLGFVETFDLNPRGSAFFPEIMLGIIEKFSFQKFPQKFEEMDESKGIDFVEGRWDGVTVEKLTIYQNGILVDTRAGTSESERILDEALIWGAEQFGLRYEHGMIKRKRYVSDLTFYSDVPLLMLHSAVINLQEGIGRALEERIFRERVDYSPTRIDFDFDRFQRQLPTAPFTIQRRGDTPFSDNKYFSEAPLPTDVHIALLEKFEKDVHATMERAAEGRGTALSRAE